MDETNEQQEQATDEKKERTFTQEELNHIISERTAKYRKGNEELRESLDKLKEEFDKISAAYGELSDTVEREKLVDSVAKSVGIDRTIVASLAANGEEELTAAAKRIADAMSQEKADEPDESEAPRMYIPNVGYAPSKTSSKGTGDPLGDLVRSM